MSSFSVSEMLLKLCIVSSCCNFVTFIFPGDDSRLSPTTENQRALEIELEMIRQALDGKIGEDKEEKDRFLHEFCKLRAKHQEFLNRNIQARRNLKQVLSLICRKSENFTLFIWYAYSLN